ncbi:hypothetical protein [Kribbella sp. NPDC006257]|uniref:hypothetical protein n=1 Tax=Kribbella sp. NPDC006257 TaxID=3156738 RepID=UPI0033B9767D
MSEPNTDVQQRMAIVRETDAVKQLLGRGIGSINKRGSVEVDPYVTLQLISQGIERLLKLTVMFQHHREHGEFPSVRGYQHGLNRLSEDVLSKAQQASNSSEFRVLGEDLDFAANDPTLKTLIHACSTFSSGGRYYDLDVVAGRTLNPEDSPRIAWEAIETSARADDQALLQQIAALDHDTHEAGLEEINSRITATVQRYIRFVARLWAFSPTGDIARQFSSSLYVWLTLNDDELRTQHGS